MLIPITSSSRCSFGNPTSELFRSQGCGNDLLRVHLGWSTEQVRISRGKQQVISKCSTATWQMLRYDASHCKWLVPKSIAVREWSDALRCFWVQFLELNHSKNHRASLKIWLSLRTWTVNHLTQFRYGRIEGGVPVTLQKTAVFPALLGQFGLPPAVSTRISLGETEWIPGLVVRLLRKNRRRFLRLDLFFLAWKGWPTTATERSTYDTDKVIDKMIEISLMSLMSLMSDSDNDW